MALPLVEIYFEVGPTLLRFDLTIAAEIAVSDKGLRQCSQRLYRNHDVSDARYDVFSITAGLITSVLEKP